MSLLRSVSQRFYRWASLRSVLLFFVLIVLYFVIAGILDNHANEGKEILELTVYTPTEAYEIIDSYGELGRTSYQNHLWGDCLFAVFFSTMFTFILSKLFILRFPSQTGFPNTKWNLFPFVVGLLDWTENLFVGIMISTFPQDLGILPTITITMTTIKMLCALIMVVWVVYLFIVQIARSRKIGS